MMGTWVGLCDYAVCVRVFVEGEEGVLLFLPLAVTSAHQGSVAPSILSSIPPSIPPAGQLCLVKDSVYSCLKCFIQQPSGLDTLSMSFFHTCFCILARTISHLKKINKLKMFGCSSFLRGFSRRISRRILS